MSDVPRSLQSWLSTIHTVVLTADAFQLFIMEKKRWQDNSQPQHCQQAGGTREETMRGTRAAGDDNTLHGAWTHTCVDPPTRRPEERRGVGQRCHRRDTSSRLPQKTPTKLATACGARCTWLVMTTCLLVLSAVSGNQYMVEESSDSRDKNTFVLKSYLLMFLRSVWSTWVL